MIMDIGGPGITSHASALVEKEHAIEVQEPRVKTTQSSPLLRDKGAHH